VARIYHFTDVDNLEHILEAGKLRCHAMADCAIDVADSTIKSRRMTKRVPCGPGGMVGDYVPFYFAPRSPMLFRIQHDGVEGVSSDPRRLVYFVSSTQTVLGAGCRCVFTDGNAATTITDFYDDLDLLDQVVDWPLMRARYWSNTREDGDRRRRRQAEFLVHGTVPLTLIHELGVYAPDVETSVQQIVVASGRNTTICVRPGWYF
jgi:hypothetical protein